MTPDQARQILAAARAFTKENGDRLWEALLSLDDAAELCAQATRLDWQFHPRGFHNIELHQRYGDGILPWLATRMGDDGVLHNNPWCVVPCLLACGSAEAFALVWRARDHDGRTPWGGAGDKELLTAWRERHPEVALAELERLAPVHPRARAHLRAMGRRTDDVLALLDACAAQLLPTRVRLWPPVGAHDLRLVAARRGDDWGLAIERIEGTRPSGFLAARVVVLAYGSRVKGAADGAAVAQRPVAELGAATLDQRLGPPELALAALGLDGGTVVATVPHAAHVPVPSESPLFAGLAEALTAR
jgi:hypothetical protein